MTANKPHMLGYEITDALDGLYAYDVGAVVSGIHDEALRKQVMDYLQTLPERDLDLFICGFIREHFVSPEALQAGYGMEDLTHFLNWLDGQIPDTIWGQWL